ncbi:MAG: M20/M25/M40 family metallo-hydrolase [Desulfocapsaceae bacterium]|nr:M20/M25/M40 family metallo-hydrolase [Desulfocapsaceae bacterium]
MTALPPPQDPIQPRRLLRLLQRMMDIYSPSGKEEELLGYLYAFFKKRGLPVGRQMLEDGRYNLIVAPPGVDIQLALIGHLDTVSAHDLEAFGFSREGGVISGLGAADMKGGCAAIIEACLCLWETAGPDVPAALILVVGEEENGDGAARLLEDLHFPWCIIAEPTGLAPCLAHYGYIEMQLTAQGKRRHASLARGRHSPVEKMLKTLLALTHHLDQRPEAVYNIRDLLTSKSGFAVPEWCQAWVDFHLPPHTPTGAFCAELEEVVCSPGTKDPMEVRFHTIQDGYDLPGKGPVVEALQKIYDQRALPWSPAAFPSHSDANLLWAHGIKPILLGPGSLAKAHVPDECIDEAEVLAAAGIYYQLLMEVLSSPAGQ